MKKKIAVVFGIGIIVALLVEVVVLRHRLSYMALQPSTNVSFYAHVIENTTPGYLIVDGIPENDVNHRGRYCVGLKDKNPKGVVLDVYGNQIDLAQVSVGDSVFIVYNGRVLETFPAHIHDAVLIRIIE